jgi:hypothetical protein
MNGAYNFNMYKRNFFFKNLTLGYMTKTLNHIIIFFLHQNQNIFFSNIGNQNIFLDKNQSLSIKGSLIFPLMNGAYNFNMYIKGCFSGSLQCLLGMDHLTSRGGLCFFLKKYSERRGMVICFVQKFCFG